MRGDRDQALTIAAALMTIGCGRLGYDPFGGASGDGSPADGGADAAPPGTDPDGGFPASCGSLTVTTAVDELDPDEVADPPHGGVGLSLREAVVLGNEREGADCVGFAAPMNISLGDALPAVDDAAGLSIDGEGAVTIAGSSTGSGLHIAAGPTILRGLEITGFQIGLDVDTPDAEIIDVHVHECGTGIAIDGDGAYLRDVRSHDNAGHGVHLGTGTGGTVIEQALVHDNQSAGIQGRSAAGLVIRHSTISANRESGIDASGTSTGVVIENSLVVENGRFGLAVDGAGSIQSIDYCDFFGNGDGAACPGCDVGAHSITADPLFVDASLDDYSLAPGSPAIDRGTDTGLDVNGDASGTFNGLAPDLGALESP